MRDRQKNAIAETLIYCSREQRWKKSDSNIQEDRYAKLIVVKPNQIKGNGDFI